ncbi:hypothetical protein [Mucilaginibacter sp. NFR10]|uniref:hypothetical protein n=1 Tax=Mucilaginibacter sp. NFR10 TaxID=1566292 RepID=UPI0008716ABA|nr:hypothetical protein [Mucilaginibacter sp. NFR10]SCW88348.1 hypothetical protein SAMN03159284_05373 [Mucilaginibacter sp. NFR10]
MARKKEVVQPKAHIAMMDQLAAFKAVIQAEVAAGNMNIAMAIKLTEKMANKTAGEKSVVVPVKAAKPNKYNLDPDFIRMMNLKAFKATVKKNRARIEAIQEYFPGWEPVFEG